MSSDPAQTKDNKLVKPQKESSGSGLLGPAACWVTHKGIQSWVKVATNRFHDKEQIFNVAKEETGIQPSSPGVESVAPPLEVTGGPLHATLCRTPSVSSHTSVDSTSSKQSLRLGRSLSPECRSLSDASPIAALHRSRPLSPLLLPQDSTSSLGSLGKTNCMLPTSPLPLGAIQPSLYAKPEGPVILHSNNSVGRLHLRIHYDFNRSDLHIHVIEGEDIIGAFSEPYVRLTMEPAVDSRVRQTVTKPHPNPYYDQHFKFPVSHDQLQDKSLILQVCDFDRYSRNDILGEIKLDFGEIDVTSSLEIWSDITKISKPPEELQEVLISLSYLPSAERLTVVLLKAKNLYPPENRESVEACVKVYLLANGKRVKKKKINSKKSSKNPVWNESVTFNLSSSCLQTSSVEVCIYDQGSDIIGGPIILGGVMLGYELAGAGGSHWSEMMANPRKAVAMWHSLR